MIVTHLGIGLSLPKELKKKKLYVEQGQASSAVPKEIYVYFLILKFDSLTSLLFLQSLEQAYGCKLCIGPCTTRGEVTCLHFMSFWD